MKRNKVIGLLLILIGNLILFYKREGFYGWGGYVDNSLEIILISIIIIGVFFFKKNLVRTYYF